MQSINTEAPATDKATPETVTQVWRWTDTLFSFKTTRPQGYDFVPGQYARLGMADASGMVWRAYSIVSAPTDDQLEYYGVLVPGGVLSAILKDIKPGDTIWTEKQRYGFMTIDRFADGDECWMLATGTGLGPYISILRDPAVWQKFRKLVLVHCVRHADEFSYRDELLALQQNPPPGARASLRIIESATRDAPHGTKQPQPGPFHTRITTLLETGELEQRAGSPITVESSRIMLCGNPDMIEDTRRILHARGLRPCRRVLPGQFVTENYW
jgi:ferredoxin--NADP+ reductase